MHWMRNPELIGGIPGIQTGLVELCEYLKANLGLDPVMYEIGSFAGESSEVFARYFRTVHCVDPWDDPCGAPSLTEVVLSFQERAHAAGNIVEHVTGSVEQAAVVPDESLDFVYLDAGVHSRETTLRDITAWWPKVRRGGMLGGHDWELKHLHAADIFQGVEQAAREFFRPDPEAFGVMLFQDTSWVVRKP